MPHSPVGARRFCHSSLRPRMTVGKKHGIGHDRALGMLALPPYCQARRAGNLNRHLEEGEGPYSLGSPGDSLRAGAIPRLLRMPVEVLLGSRRWSDQGAQVAVRFRLLVREVDVLVAGRDMVRPLPEAPLLDTRPLVDAGTAVAACGRLLGVTPNFVAASTRSW